mmetsp:Transcript_88057/g.257406  ORF Transcript_88057/g.257406 Transcript_88057/m.257406 type:complete len:230 (-) Transcript_88057:1618-2307(-)
MQQQQQHAIEADDAGECQDLCLSQQAHDHEPSRHNGSQDQSEHRLLILGQPHKARANHGQACHIPQDAAICQVHHADAEEEQGRAAQPRWRLCAVHVFLRALSAVASTLDDAAKGQDSAADCGDVQRASQQQKRLRRIADAGQEGESNPAEGHSAQQPRVGALQQAYPGIRPRSPLPPRQLLRLQLPLLLPQPHQLRGAGGRRQRGAATREPAGKQTTNPSEPTLRLCR